MVQLSSLPEDLPADFDPHVVRFPTRSAADVRAELPEQPADGPVPGPPVGVSTHGIGQVVVLEVARLLSDEVQDLDRAIQRALAEGPRGVLCDLSAVLDGADPCAVEVLAMAGRHVRDWPAIPVAVACPDPRVREALSAHPLGGHLIVTSSVPPALSAVAATPAPAVQWLRLAPHPTAPRASRNFVTRRLLDWGLGPLVLPAGLAVHELVANSIHAGTDIDVSVAWDRGDLGALRLTVRDDSPDLPRQRYSHDDPYARRLSVVAVLSRAFGVLPTTDGGRVVWAVLSAAWPPGSTSPRSPEPAVAVQE
jgi:hypothetical protein